MEELEILNDYLNNCIVKLEKEDASKRKQLIDIENLLNIMNSDLQNINILDFQQLFDYLYLQNASAKLQIFIANSSLFPFLDDLNLCEEPQIKKVQKYLQDFQTELETEKKKIQLSLEQRKEKMSEELVKYHYYLSFFTKDQIVKPMSIAELSDFINFLKSSELNRDLIEQIIILFTKFNSQYLQNAKNNMTKENTETILLLSLTKEEKDIYDKVKQILEEFKKNINLQIDITGVFNNDQYILSERKEYYDLDIIYAIKDLENNLLPNFLHHKNDILIIFKYIINLYDNYQQEKERCHTLLKKYDLNSEELSVIASYLQQYNALSIEDKQLISSAYTVIEFYEQDSCLQITNGLYSKEEVIFYANIKKLSDYMEYYNESKNDLLNVYDDFGNQIESLLLNFKECCKELRQILMTIKEYEEQRHSEIKEDSDLLDQTIDKKNIFIFLEDKTYNFFVDSVDMDVLLTNRAARKSKEKVIANIQTIFEKYLLGKTYLELKTQSKEGIYRHLVTFEAFRNLEKLGLNDVFRIRRGEFRLPITIISLDQKNALELKETFNISENEFRLYLIFGYYVDLRGNHDYVLDVARRINANLQTIKYIQQIFSTPFTNETRKIAYDLINRSFASYQNLSQLKKIEENNHHK